MTVTEPGAPRETADIYDKTRAQMGTAWTVRRFAFRWLKRAAIGVLAVVFVVHMYALLLGLMLPPTTLNMIGSSIAGRDVQHNSVSLDEISPHLVRAVIAAEDSRFCTHPGIDMDAINQALRERNAGGRLRGASTISQQTAKNVFLWNGGGFVRKGVEAWFTLIIESFWGKARIMDAYLNIAEWGDGIYGAEAAAQARFGVSAADLSPYQAALLASVLPNPNAWRVDPPGNYVSGRASTIQQRMGIVQRDGLAACVLD